VSEKDEKGPIDQLLSFLGSFVPLEPIAFFAKTLPKYVRTAFHVVSKGPRFGKSELRTDESKVPATAVAFYLCGLVLSLLLVRPILRRHDLHIDWIFFILESLYLQSLTLLFIYAAVKLAKGKGTLTQTIRAYAYWVGMILPLVFVLHYTIYWFITAHNLPNRWHVQVASFTVVLPNWKGWWMWASYAAMSFLVLLFAWRWLLQWLCDIHQVRRRRILTSMLILLVPLTYLQVAVMQPYVARALGSTAGYLHSWKKLSVKDLVP